MFFFFWWQNHRWFSESWVILQGPLFQPPSKFWSVTRRRSPVCEHCVPQHGCDWTENPWRLQLCPPQTQNPLSWRDHGFFPFTLRLEKWVNEPSECENNLSFPFKLKQFVWWKFITLWVDNIHQAQLLRSQQGRCLSLGSPSSQHYNISFSSQKSQRHFVRRKSSNISLKDELFFKAYFSSHDHMELNVQRRWLDVIRLTPGHSIPAKTYLCSARK